MEKICKQGIIKNKYFDINQIILKKRDALKNKWAKIIWEILLTFLYPFSYLFSFYLPSLSTFNITNYFLQ